MLRTLACAPRGDLARSTQQNEERCLALLIAFHIPFIIMSIQPMIQMSKTERGQFKMKLFFNEGVTST
jgi:hypothetical protein